jgi:hypothetical protein
MAKPLPEIPRDRSIRLPVTAAELEVAGELAHRARKTKAEYIRDLFLVEARAAGLLKGKRVSA